MKKISARIAGSGCVCAAGNTLDEAMRSMYSGTRAPEKPKSIQAALDNTYPVFEVDCPLGGFAPDATRTVRLALKAATEALEDAGLDAAALKSRRVGVCIGTTVGCTLNNEPFYRAYRSGEKPGMEAIGRYLANNPALYLAEKFNLDGPAMSVVNACSSGSDAIGLAASWLRDGLCDIAIAGGADELARITYLGFISLLIASTEPCRPFDKNRKGLNLGEGAGILVLETPESAARRNARAMTEIIAYGSAADAHHPTKPHPEGKGLKLAFKQAFASADISPAQIAFVNAHGTSTHDNDRAEGRTIAEFFSKNMPVVSTKAYTGHTLGAAGGIEAVFAARALVDGKLPATIGFEEPDEECVVAPTAKNTLFNGDCAVSTSLAFGGHNSALVFRRLPT